MRTEGSMAMHLLGCVLVASIHAGDSGDVLPGLHLFLRHAQVPGL